MFLFVIEIGEYVEEDEDDLTGGPGQDPSAKGKIRKKKTRTVFSRSQVNNKHHYTTLISIIIGIFL